MASHERRLSAGRSDLELPTEDADPGNRNRIVSEGTSGMTQRPPDQGSRRCACGGSNESCYRCFGKGVEVDSSFRPLAPSRSWNKSPRNKSLIPPWPVPELPAKAKHFVRRPRVRAATAPSAGVSPSAKTPVVGEWVICRYCGVPLKRHRQRRHLRWVHNIPQGRRSRLQQKLPKNARNTPTPLELSPCPQCRLRMPRSKLAHHISTKHPGR
jgi:hypothetical protein